MKENPVSPPVWAQVLRVVSREEFKRMSSHHIGNFVTERTSQKPKRTKDVSLGYHQSVAATEIIEEKSDAEER